MERDYDEIRIEELKVFAHHGVYDFEKEQGQDFYLNLTLFLDTLEAGKTDDLTKTINYGEVCQDLNQWMQEKSYDLLEAAAQGLAEKLLVKYERLHHLSLEIRKPQAPIKLPFGSVSVQIRRGWHEVYLSIGSNLGDREKYLVEAVAQLENCPQMRRVRMSSLIETKPYGGVEQGDFLNGAVVLDTLLTPRELLDYLHGIENRAGRTREIHWGPRTLDLDILFYDDLIYGDDQLILPHMDLANREFVLKPLCELAPGLRHPISHKTVAQMLAELSWKGF